MAIVFPRSVLRPLGEECIFPFLSLPFFSPQPRFRKEATVYRIFVTPRIFGQTIRNLGDSMGCLCFLQIPDAGTCRDMIHSSGVLG